MNEIQITDKDAEIRGLRAELADAEHTLAAVEQLRQDLLSQGSISVSPGLLGDVLGTSERSIEVTEVLA